MPSAKFRAALASRRILAPNIVSHVSSEHSINFTVQITFPMETFNDVLHFTIIFLPSAEHSLVEGGTN